MARGDEGPSFPTQEERQRYLFLHRTRADGGPLDEEERNEMRLLERLIFPPANPVGDFWTPEELGHIQGRNEPGKTPPTAR